jgi:hypothetical protein
MSLPGSELSVASDDTDGEAGDAESGGEDPESPSTNDGYASEPQQTHLNANSQPHEDASPVPPHVDSPTQLAPPAPPQSQTQPPTNPPPQPPTHPAPPEINQELLELIPEASQPAELDALWLDVNDPIDLSDEDDESDDSFSQAQQLQQQLQQVAGILVSNLCSLVQSSSINFHHNRLP